MKTTRYKETYAYTKNEITVYVRIDYVNNRISLMDKKGSCDFSPKKWLFQDRGVEYMQGWINILDVMQEAITDAKKRYELYLAENSRFVDDQIEDMLKIIPKKKRK